MTKPRTSTASPPAPAQRERSARRQRQRLARAARIERERKEMNLAPWKLAPSEVDAGPSPWPAGTVGHDSWLEAQRQRAEILQRNPDYFLEG